jgi:hypothetical protein
MLQRRTFPWKNKYHCISGGTFRCLLKTRSTGEPCVCFQNPALFCYNVHAEYAEHVTDVRMKGVL